MAAWGLYSQIKELREENKRLRTTLEEVVEAFGYAEDLSDLLISMALAAHLLRTGQPIHRAVVGPIESVRSDEKPPV